MDWESGIRHATASQHMPLLTASTPRYTVALAATNQHIAIYDMILWP
jgi:hypothetical protein